MIGIERHQESTEIGNILTQSLAAVDVKSRKYFIAIELMRQLLGPPLEMLGIGRSPPVTQAPACVNFAALIVKPVGDFVANDRADGAIAMRRIRFRIKKGRFRRAAGKMMRFSDAILKASTVCGVIPQSN